VGVVGGVDGGGVGGVGWGGEVGVGCKGGEVGGMLHCCSLGSLWVSGGSRSWIGWCWGL